MQSPVMQATCISHLLVQCRSVPSRLEHLPDQHSACTTTARTSSGQRTRFLPDNIYDAVRLFKGSRFATELLGEEVHGKFAELKLMQAERCPKALGSQIKIGEGQLHHEVPNQYLWSKF